MNTYTIKGIDYASQTFGVYVQLSNSQLLLFKGSYDQCLTAFNRLIGG